MVEMPTVDIEEWYEERDTDRFTIGPDNSRFTMAGTSDGMTVSPASTDRKVTVFEEDGGTIKMHLKQEPDEYIDTAEYRSERELAYELQTAIFNACSYITSDEFAVMELEPDPMVAGIRQAKQELGDDSEIPEIYRDTDTGERVIPLQNGGALGITEHTFWQEFRHASPFIDFIYRALYPDAEPVR